MGRRAQAEQIEQQPLVVALVAIREEAGLRPPAVRERRAAVSRPVPVGPAVERVGQAADLGLVGRVAIEVGGGGEHAREQERRIDRGQLALPDAAAGFDVEEVIEEALVSRRVRLRPLGKIVQEAEPAAGPLGRERPEEHAAFDDDRERRQGHPHGGDAARRGRIGFVPDQPVVGVGLVQVVQHVVRCSRRTLGLSATGWSLPRSVAFRTSLISSHYLT